MSGKYFIDLRGNPYDERHYADLLTTLHGTRPQAPPLGSVPLIKTEDVAARLIAEQQSDSEPIRITGIIADDVTPPRNDGTRGSGLYEIPFRFSRQPPRLWQELFVRAWDHPSLFTQMHRSGIASVEGDVVWLRGTTLDEVERYHRDTLVLAVNAANAEYAQTTQVLDELYPVS